MNARMRKILYWAVGLALVGAFLGAKGSYADTWYGLLKDSWTPTLIGAGVGAILGYVFSRRLPKFSK